MTKLFQLFVTNWLHCDRWIQPASAAKLQLRGTGIIWVSRRRAVCLYKMDNKDIFGKYTMENKSLLL